MEIRKAYQLILILIIFLNVSCGKREEKIRKQQNTISRLEEQLHTALDNARYKDNLLSSIEDELYEIDKSFITIGINEELGSFNVQADRIEGRIENLKQQLDQKIYELSNSNKENSSLLNFIKKYREELLSKENVIRNLRNDLNNLNNYVGVLKNDSAKLANTVLEKENEVIRLNYKMKRTKISTYKRISDDFYSAYSILNNPSIEKPTKIKFKREELDSFRELRSNILIEAQEYKNKAKNLQNR